MNRSLWKTFIFLMIPGMVLVQTPVNHAELVSKNTVSPAQEMHPCGPDHRRAFEEHHQQMMEQLGLTPEQKKKMDALHQQGREQGHAMFQQIHEKKRALMQYLGSPNATEARALAMQKEIDELHSRMSTQRIKTWFQMREILTPEQLKKMEQLHKEHRPPMGFSPEHTPMKGSNP